MRKTYDISIAIDDEDNEHSPTGRSFLASYTLTEGEGQRLVGNKTQVIGTNPDSTLSQVLDEALIFMEEDIEEVIT